MARQRCAELTSPPLKWEVSSDVVGEKKPKQDGRSKYLTSSPKDCLLRFMRQTDEASHQVADEKFMRGEKQSLRRREENHNCPSDAEEELFSLKNDLAAGTANQL